MRAFAILVLLLLAITLGAFGCTNKPVEQPKNPNADTTQKVTPPETGKVKPR